MLPARTVKGSAFDVPEEVTSSIVPVVAAAPGWKVILVSDQIGYEEAVPPPIET